MILLLLSFTLVNCDQSPKVSAEVADSIKEEDARTGLVLETIDVEEFTFIRLDQHGQEVWIASNPVTIPKGELVRYSGEIMMKDFQSKSLDRVFPVILFVQSVQPVEAGSMTFQEDLATTPDVTDLHNKMSARPIAESGPIVIEPLDGGMTIAGIISEYGQIEGQEVSLRAKVTKFSPNILQKNWITLQDGTGTAPNDKLVVTTSETVAVGDEVIVTGLVRINVDIGAGYVYEVLLENARLSK